MKTLTDNRKDVAREIARKYDVKLSVDSLNKLTNLLQPTKFRHRTYILNSGVISQNICYIVKGLIRQYKIVDDIDVVEDITHEGDMLICTESLLKQQPSKLFIQTLEPTISYAMDYIEFRSIADKSEDLNQLLYSILEAQILHDKDKYHLLDETPIDRYNILLKTNSEIVRRTPLKYVASYLRMAPETLSRVRNAINKHENSNS